MNKGARIVVIEDDVPSRELVTYLLQESGHTVFSATDGEAGVEVTQRERPDLVVCDVNLPKLDGYGVVRRLKQDTALQNIPVVAVTALAMIGDRSKMLSTGFDGYISKPIDAETFVTEVTAFLPVSARTGASQNGAAKTEAITTETRAIVQQNATILVVDDTPTNIEFARSTLEASGYKVLAASSVQEAIKLAEDNKPHLVLCDLHMLPQSGHDLLEIAVAHQSFKRIPIVIISSTYSNEGERLQCLERGAAHFVKRPIEPQALLMEIARALAQTKTS